MNESGERKPEMLRATQQKIAVVGSGISGLIAASLLDKHHDVTIFEAGDYFGGHTNTVEIQTEGKTIAVDTGFIVFNDVTYPNFLKFLTKYNVASQPTTMSFSFHDEATGFEYNGTTLNTLFAQRSNLISVKFYKMLSEIIRFNREGKAFAANGNETILLGDYLRERKYSQELIEWYVIPMGAAIWSSKHDQMKEFPAKYFLQFFNHHQMLNVNERPVWRTISGGSREYVRAMMSQFSGKAHTKSPVERIERTVAGIRLTVTGAQPMEFDQIVIAAHSDQALRMLADPSQSETEILGAIPYQKNMAYLHSDIRVLPSRRKAWAAWNSRLLKDSNRTALSYQMNLLQNLPLRETQLIVTLNEKSAIDETKMLQEIEYHHPVYTLESVAAQRRKAEISGVNRTHYCGAYWHFGFHEDGAKSALEVGSHFGVAL